MLLLFSLPTHLLSSCCPGTWYPAHFEFACDGCSSVCLSSRCAFNCSQMTSQLAATAGQKHVSTAHHVQASCRLARLVALLLQQSTTQHHVCKRLVRKIWSVAQSWYNCPAQAPLLQSVVPLGW